MNSEEIQNAKNNYLSLILLQRKFEQAKIDIEKLKEEPLIKKYFELYEFIDSNKDRFENDNMIIESFDEIAKNSTDSQNIYVCIGRYYFNVKDGKVTNESGGFPWDAKEYRNIETMESKYVPIGKTVEFEQQNKIIFLDDKKDYGGSKHKFYNSKFLLVRNKFFEFLLEDTQEKSLQKILSIYNK